MKFNFLLLALSLSLLSNAQQFLNPKPIKSEFLNEDRPYMVYLPHSYNNETFVHVDNKVIPKLSDVQNTNNVKISVFTNKSKKTIIIMSLLDNLIKGAAGQAIQNMNLMFDFKEHESLL